MNQNHLNHLSAEQVEDRFDLLATDAKEYAIFLVGLDGRLVCWNPGAERLYGYQAPEIIGQHFSCFFSPEDIASGRPEHELATALAAGKSDSAGWQIRKDGSRFWGKSTVTPLRDQHKQVQSLARVVHDLTDSKAQEAQKQRADDLADANRAKEDFMALLSHELRGPLSPILHALSILRRMNTNDPIIEQASNIINRQILLMVRLVDDLLDISRITKGKLRLTKERVELRDIANHAAETVRPLMDGRKHDFSLSLPTAPVWIEGDPARLEQIVGNLLNNAAKYTDVGGLVRMSVRQEGAEASISVRDNGVGIAPGMVQHVFDLFTQLDGSLSRSYGGLGIGLALVRTLVEMQGGKVQVQSRGLDQGAEFTVTFPAAAALLEDSRTVVKSQKPDGLSTKILVVEDNVDAGDSLSLLLRLHGHDVQVARTGPAALTIAAAFLPDVVLLDIGLPGMDGYQVAQHLRERPECQSIMICALTGFTPNDADRERQHQTGFDHYFVKPVEISKLLELFGTVTIHPVSHDHQPAARLL